MSFMFRDQGGRERRRCLEVLGLTDPVSDDDIRRAYKTSALKYHPDKNPSPDAKEKFQEISSAYKYLQDGNSFLTDAMEEDDFNMIFVIQQLFPWLFEDSRCSSFGFMHQRSSARSSSGRRNFSGWSPFDPPPTNNRSSRGHTGHYRGRGFSFYYGDDSSDEEESSEEKQSKSPPPQTGPAPQHGQFFHEQAERRGAKKKKRNAKRAQKIQEDQVRPSSNQNGKTFNQIPSHQRSTKPESEGGKQPQTTQTNHITKEAKSDESSTKKTRKQILAEQKQREKEMAQVRKDLLKMEAEKKVKMVKKRLIEEERERKEKKEREEEEIRERIRLEAEEEELRRKEEEKKKQEEEARRVQKLMEEFDSLNFLDATGDFKTCQPDLVNMIQRDDLSGIDNVDLSLGEHVDSPTGSMGNFQDFNPSDLIRLQKAQQDQRNQAINELLRPTTPPAPPTDNQRESRRPRSQQTLSPRQRTQSPKRAPTQSPKRHSPSPKNQHSPSQKPKSSLSPREQHSPSPRRQTRKPPNSPPYKGTRVIYNQNKPIRPNRVTMPHFRGPSRPPRPLLPTPHMGRPPMYYPQPCPNQRPYYDSFYPPRFPAHHW